MGGILIIDTPHVWVPASSIKLQTTKKNIQKSCSIDYVLNPYIWIQYSFFPALLIKKHLLFKECLPILPMPKIIHIIIHFLNFLIAGGTQ
jgi:hypothetical protein